MNITEHNTLVRSIIREEFGDRVETIVSRRVYVKPTISELTRAEVTRLTARIRDEVGDVSNVVGCSGNTLWFYTSDELLNRS